MMNLERNWGGGGKRAKKKLQKEEVKTFSKFFSLSILVKNRMKITSQQRDDFL
jgi:hypothetical protein